MSKWAAYIILGGVAFAVVLGSFLISPLATPVMRYTANNFVEGLKIEDVSGSLSNALHIKNIHFSNAAATVTIADVKLDIDWSCSDFENICFDVINIQSPHVNVTPQDTQEALPEASNEVVTLPIALQLASVTITDIQAMLPNMNIGLSSATFAASWQESLRLVTPQLRELTVLSTLPGQPPEPFTGLSYEAPSLPAVFVPLHLEIDNFSLVSAQYGADDKAQNIESISLANIVVQGSALNWKQLNIVHQQGSLQSTGNLNLSDSYPITLTLEAGAKLNEAQSQTMDAKLSGSLANLKADVALKGVVNGEANLAVAILDDMLPIEGRVSWPAQDVNYNNIEHLDAGSMLVSGNMGRYGLIVDSAVTLSPLGYVVFKTNLELNQEAFLINQLDADLLNGSITTSGKVNFVKEISGTGITQAEGVELAALLSQNGKLEAWQDITLEQASWQYIIQQQNKGIELLLSDINADIKQADNQMNVAGQAVYSQANDLGVVSLSLNQADQKNAIIMQAQVLNQAFINLNANVQLNELSTLIAQTQGQLTGNVALSGEWQNPTFTASLNAIDISLPESMSKAVAQLGKLNATFDGQGTYAQHDIALSANSDDYAITAGLSGQWANNQWTSKLNQASAGIFSTQWNLQNPADVLVNAQTQSYQLGSHCWQQLTSPAKVCIDDAKHSSGLSEWSVLAEELPVGIWAQRVFTQLQNVSDTATLSLVSSGTLSGEEGLQAQSSLTVAPSKWTLTGTHPVTLSLETITANAIINNEMLNAQAVFSSPELGEIVADINANAFEPLTQPSIIELGFNNVTVAPFADLSPSIYALDGFLNGEITLSEAIVKPSVIGSLKLQDGKIDIEQSPLVVSGWQQTLVFDGMQAEIDGSFNLGEGPGTIKGTASWQDEPKVSIDFDAKGIAVAHEEIKLTMSPQLNTLITPNSVKVTGNIDIPYARIKLDSLPESAISPSKDVHLRGEPPPTDPLKQIDANLFVTIDSKKTGEVKLDAFGLNANLEGNLQIINQPALVGYGDLRIINGRYKAYGQNLIIRTGEVQLNGPISQPFLFVEAIRNPELTDDGVIAGVRIEGAASAPSVSLFAEPAMDQGQALLYLLSGNGNLQQSSGSESEVYTSALLGFGLANSGALTSGIGKAMGIDDFSVVTTGQGENTKVAVSGRIAKNLTLRYGVGVFDNVPEVALRYQILPKLYIEAVKSLSDAVDLYYEFSVGELEQGRD